MDKYSETYPTEFDIDVTVGHKYWILTILPHFNDGFKDVKELKNFLKN